MNNFFDDLKYTFQRRDNGLMQIIVVNIICFLASALIRLIFYWSNAGAYFEAIFSFLSLPSDLTKLVLRPWTFVTYSFFHDFSHIWHILFNMLWLYWFGKLIHDFLGNKRFLTIYFSGVLAGGFLYVLIYNVFPFFQDDVSKATLIGASAGVTAVIVAAAAYMPNYTFFMMFLGPIKIVYIAIFSVALSVINAMGSNAGGEIAHIGGAMIGYLFVVQMRKGNDWSDASFRFIHGIKGMFKPKPKIKVSYKKEKSNGAHRSNGQRSGRGVDQEEIDRILDKISERGYEALTKEEKEKLFNASKDS